MVREGIKITKKVEHLLIPEVAEYIERRKLYK
jgi:nicotinic acid mononucleotide adenylyltransferase